MKGKKTGGREKGTPNKKTVINLLVLADGGPTPSEFLRKVMVSTDPNIGLGHRIEAAKALMPFCHPRFGIIEPEVKSIEHDPRENIVELVSFAAKPEYLSRLHHVWRVHDELPENVRQRLGIPLQDVGIDLVAKASDGEYWTIQCKFRADRDAPLTYKELSTFSHLSFVTCRGIALALVVHTTSKPIRKRTLLKNTTEIGLDRWLALTRDEWKQIRALCRHRKVSIEPRMPKPHQRKAVAAAKAARSGLRSRNQEDCPLIFQLIPLGLIGRKAGREWEIGSRPILTEDRAEVCDEISPFLSSDQDCGAFPDFFELKRSALLGHRSHPALPCSDITSAPVFNLFR